MARLFLWANFFYYENDHFYERDTDIGVFQSNLDPATTTDPLDDDSDNDGWLDGEEDQNYNGRVDVGEKDPNRYDTKVLPCIPLLLLDNE